MDPILPNPLQPAGQSVLARLRDIQGIDGVPWWPPGPGWWALLAALVLLGLVAWNWRTTLRLRIPIPGITLGTWRWDGAAALRQLRRRVRTGLEPKEAASALSELLRRIAMARLGRDACAGLTGQDWLDWLAQNDPQRFPWGERGGLLLTAPYAPPGAVTGRELLGLIDAAYGWVSAPDQGPAGRRRGWGWIALSRRSAEV